MTAPYYEFIAGGMNVDLASIKGGPIPIDPMSFKWFIKSDYDDRFLKDPDFQQKTQSLKIDDIDFTKYDIIYLAGGWGAAYDLGISEVLGRKISEAYAAGQGHRRCLPWSPRPCFWPKTKKALPWSRDAI